MIDRTRLALSGVVLAVVSLTIFVGLSWTDYQSDLEASTTNDFEWMPTYWQYARSGIAFTTHFLFAAGIVMILVALAMKRPQADDRQFRP